ncbi:MAG: flippase-like domain-containing protein [Gammaproteobacteria bacterium]|nr:flippase-like domain-containing protein [Gammaproteobacteria bacterium]MCP5299317.1 flippase-like domain-containing protein [Chromatiaceae bacterium]
MISRFGRQLKWMVAIVLLLALAVWVERTVGWRELLRPWTRFPASELVLLVGLTAVSYLTRAMRLYDLYHPRLGGAFHRYLRINVLHTTLLNLLPMRMGEAAFPVMMKRNFGERYANSVANLVWLRVADLWILLWLGCVVFAIKGTSWLWPIVVAGVIMPLLLQPLRAFILRASDGNRNRAARLSRLLVEGLPNGYTRYLRLLFWGLATWSAKLAAFVSIAGFFVAGPEYALLPGVIAAEISNALPIQGLAGFGNYELAMVMGGAWSGIPTEGLLAAAVNLHLFILACTLLFGAMAWLIPTAEHRG